jgi:peptide/nickel transport system substrate-binding protein
LSSMRTGAKVLASLAAASLLLSACASNDDSGGTASQQTTAPITFRWAYEQEFASYNGNTADGNSVANNAILTQTVPGFWVFAPDGSIQPDKDFGTFEKTSDNPLTVKYTFNDKAVWSDGNPVDCDDFVLAWLANSGVTGENGFSSAATFGYEDQNKPQCKDGDKTVTVVYKKTFADWAGLYGSPTLLPAHIVEKQAGIPDIIAAADTPTSPEMKKAETFYNEGWNVNPGQIKPDIMLSSGRYKISQWQAGQSLTLTANDKWWGTPPKSKTLVVRYLGGDQQVQALQNGEVDAMDPQPQVELVNQLKALGDRVKFSTHDQYTFEHLDYNFRGAFADKNLREAFTKCVPRQQIVDNLIKPQNPDAKIIQSRYVYPFQESYSQFENGVGGEKYNTVDIPGAKALLAAAGKTGLTVRVGWRKDPAQLNKRRVDTLALIQASCNQAGFKVVDTGTPDFFEKALPDGNFDVAMFAWTGSPLVTGSSDIYITGGGSNFGKYKGPQVDQLTAQLNGEIDTTKQVDLMKKIDTQLWTDLVTIPLFAFPGILATVPEAEGVEYNATQQELMWNAQSWSLKQ